MFVSLISRHSLRFLSLALFALVTWSVLGGYLYILYDELGEISSRPELTPVVIEEYISYNSILH